MPRLLLTTAEGTHSVELRAVNSLGRHPNNTIQVLDKIVSKEHCIVEQRADGFWLRDLGSLNGTYVNNERVRGEAPLKHGDEILMGSTRGRFDDGSSPLPAGVGAPGARPPAPPVSGANAVPSAQRPPGSGQQPYPGWQQGQAAPSAGLPFRAPSQAPSTVPSGSAGGAAGSYPPPPMYAPQSAAAASAAAASAAAASAAAANAAAANAAANVRQGGTAPLESPARLPGLVPPPGMPAGALRNAPSAGSYVAHGTRIDFNDQARQIGTQIDAVEKGFLSFERIATDMNQLRADYERLRLSHELSHAIGVERDTTKLLDKILASVLKFITADRAVIFLRDETGELRPASSQRRDGTLGAITVSSTILDHVVKERAAVLTHDAAMDFAASKGKSMILNRISSAIVAPLLQHDNEVLGVLWLDSETLARFQAKDLELVQTVANQAARFIEINILGKKVEIEIVNRDRLSRLLSPNIAERVINGQLEVKPGGERVDECTVFNSDIRGFTSMSESAAPEELVELLNEYFELMVDTVFKYEGTLDKFMGDGIMALWGAPVQHPEDPIRSVDAALEMADVLGQLNRRRLAKEQAPLAVGIGIHTGPLVAGYIGSSKALSYTVIGDTANVSARLCSHALAGQIVVSEPTLVRLKNRFEFEELASAKVKGKEKPLRVYNILRRAVQVQVPGAVGPGGVFSSEPTTASSH